MRLRHLLPFAAVAVLAGCNEQPANSSSAARAPIPAAACPPTPACVPETPKTVAAKAAPAGKAVVRKAVAHKPAQAKPRAVARQVARADRSAYEEGLAGGPPASQYRRYRGPDLPTQAPYAYRRYGDGGYRYGALPAPDGYDDAPSSGYDYRHGGAGRPPQPRDRGHAAEDRGARSSESYSSRETGGWRRDGGRRDDRGDYGYDAEGRDAHETEAFVERRAYRDGRWMRSERHDTETSSSSFESRSVSGQRSCCDGRPGEAAGFDRNGFLTWPGKVPARP